MKKLRVRRKILNMKQIGKEGINSTLKYTYCFVIFGKNSKEYLRAPQRILID